MVVSVNPRVNVTADLLIAVGSQAVAPLAPQRQTGVFVKGLAKVKVQAVGLPVPVVIVPATSLPVKDAPGPQEVTVDPVTTWEFR